MPRRIKAAALALAILVSYAGWKGLGALLGPGPGGPRAEGRISMQRKVAKTDKEWKEIPHARAVPGHEAVRDGAAVLGEIQRP